MVTMEELRLDDPGASPEVIARRFSQMTTRPSPEVVARRQENVVRQEQERVVAMAVAAVPEIFRPYVPMPGAPVPSETPPRIF